MKKTIFTTALFLLALGSLAAQERILDCSTKLDSTLSNFQIKIIDEEPIQMIFATAPWKEDFADAKKVWDGEKKTWEYDGKSYFEYRFTYNTTKRFVTNMDDVIHQMAKPEFEYYSFYDSYENVNFYKSNHGDYYIFSTLHMLNMPGISMDFHAEYYCQ